LLCLVASRLQHGLRAEDTAARLGGDEFAVLIPGLTSAAEARATAERLLDRVHQPATIEGRPMNIRASVGVALGAAGDDGDPIVRNADTAMYWAKQQGKAQVVLFTPERAPLSG